MPAKSARTVAFCACHDTTAACWSTISVHFHLQWRPSPSNEAYLCPFGPRNEIKGQGLILNCFSRAALNLFDFGNQSVPTHLATKTFRSVRSSALWRGLRHALRVSCRSFMSARAGATEFEVIHTQGYLAGSIHHERRRCQGSAVVPRWSVAVGWCDGEDRCGGKL